MQAGCITHVPAMRHAPAVACAVYCFNQCVHRLEQICKDVQSVLILLISNLQFLTPGHVRSGMAASGVRSWPVRPLLLGM